MSRVKLPAEPRSIAVARRFVADALAAAGATAPTAVLLASELASNVVLHAQTDFDLSVVVAAGTVRVELRDGLAVVDAFRELLADHTRIVDAREPSGRGMLLLNRLATTCGLIDHGPHGKAVWFEVPTDVPGPST